MIELVPTPLPVDPLTASTWRIEAAVRGQTLEEFLTEAVDRLLSAEPRLEEPAARPLPSRTNW